MVPGVRKRSSKRIATVTDAPHRPAWVVTKLVVEGVDGMDVIQDRGGGRVCVEQDDI